MDGLVADSVTARFPDWRFLGLLSYPRAAERFAGDKKQHQLLHPALSVIGSVSCRPKIYAGRPTQPCRYSDRHQSLSLFQSGYRAALDSQCRGLVSTPTREVGLSRPRHGAIRRITRATGLLNFF